MNIGWLMVKAQARTRLFVAAFVVAGFATGAIGGVNVERALSQIVGTGSTTLCAQMAFDTRENTEQMSVLLSADGPGETLASVAHAQNCTGPATATFSAVTDTTPNSVAFVRAHATCTGGGCVGGTQVFALPGGIDHTELDASLDPGFESHALTFVFPSLPRGRYTITVEGFATPTLGAEVSARSLVVQGFGPGTPSLP